MTACCHVMKAFNSAISYFPVLQRTTGAIALAAPLCQQVVSRLSGGSRLRRADYNTLLTVVTDKLLPQRPYRYEPRLKKQRPKSYGWMQQPRHVLKRKLAA